MIENNINEQENKEKDLFPFLNFQTLYTGVILNWKWLVLSLLIFLGLAQAYLRYTTPIYSVSAKMLIKEEDRGRSSRSSLQSATSFGVISNSTGLYNEMEILKSRDIATEVVRDLKLYATYNSVGRVRNLILYRNQPISVDIDAEHLDRLLSPIFLEITRKGNEYHVSGSCTAPQSAGGQSGARQINRILSSFPATINTAAGRLTFTKNEGAELEKGGTMTVLIQTPESAAYRYAAALSIVPNTNTTTIAQLSITDEVARRAQDYLVQLVNVYNRQANEDKNEVAKRTEEFINGRLEKINAELNETEGSLENYKKRHQLIEVRMSAGQAMGNADTYEQRLNEVNMQIALFNSVQHYMGQSGHKYQLLPANIGITDAGIADQINKYNEVVLERNRRLLSASENSPVITPLTEQLNELSTAIRKTMAQARRNLEIQRSNIASQFGKYQGQISSTPEQERIMTQIGRQQDVKSGLYLMLLQKREENSISLAATADKGRLIDAPSGGSRISPQSSVIMGVAFVLGLAFPILILFVLQLFHYKIEGRNDVERLTKLPILADVAVANDHAKTRGDIVVHENKNNQMEEIFRSIRTNLQFMMKEHEKVIMFTSTTSGEGKTFNAANLAVSFALLNKKVVLVGLDIRKPRLAELFEIDNHKNGITNVLILDDPTEEDIAAELLPSEVNRNLDLLMSGPIPPNPAELIARPSLEKILNILKEKYDYVIIDTAPIGLVTDTLQISRVADTTVYVCRADYTPKESFKYINTLAEEKKLPNMSIVINGIDMSKKKYGYYYGYGRYGKYGKYGRYGKYGNYRSYGNTYGSYVNSHYGDKNDSSIKL